MDTIQMPNVAHILRQRYNMDNSSANVQVLRAQIWV